MCVFKGSLALNLFHMTHTHMASVWTLSRFVCLSVCLPFPLLGRVVQERRWVKEGWGWIFPGHNRSFVMTRARPCHTPGLWWLLLSRRVGFIQGPPLCLSIFLQLHKNSTVTKHRLHRPFVPPKSSTTTPEELISATKTQPGM